MGRNPKAIAPDICTVEPYFATDYATVERVESLAGFAGNKIKRSPDFSLLFPFTC
jgi:hypothetical protein